MLKFSAIAEGQTSGDLELALEQMLRLVREGFTSGADKNDTGRYTFTVDGEEGPPAPVDPDEFLTCPNCGVNAVLFGVADITVPAFEKTDTPGVYNCPGCHMDVEL